MDDATLARLGHLSRILMQDEERAALLQDLRTILRFVDEIKSVQTEGVEPLAHPLDTVQTLRTDSVIDDIEREKYQQIASKTADGFYVVPKVIDP